VPAETVHATVLICTYNRERLLAEALDSLAAVQPRADLRWEVLVVDNNSTDATRQVVERRAGTYPVPLRYLFEGRQGKAHALNTGIASSHAQVVVFTDDDVRVAPEWLEAGVRPLLQRSDIDYTGGPARPRWEAPPPRWLSGDPGRMWGPIALVDYGPEEFIFEDRRRIALGVNMAVRRAVIDRVGGFHIALERKGTSLMGQGQAEFFFRTRAAGLRGLYIPRMTLEHFVPASRLTRRYYRRWWYWKGVARAQMQEFHPVTELGLDLGSLPSIAGTPRFMWVNAVRYGFGWLRATLSGDRVRQAETESKLSYFLGYVRTRLRLRRARTKNPGPRDAQSAASAEPDPAVAVSTPGSEILVPMGRPLVLRDLPQSDAAAKDSQIPIAAQEVGPQQPAQRGHAASKLPEPA
jgi:glycosyltransferase involved in cell wall biosynthesis